MAGVHNPSNIQYQMAAEGAQAGERLRTTEEEQRQSARQQAWDQGYNQNVGMEEARVPRYAEGLDYQDVQEAGHRQPVPEGVDAWIDLLDDIKPNAFQLRQQGVNSEMMMACLMQQYLPKIELPTFDGSPLDWVEFVSKFKEIVHDQQYLSDGQKMQLLTQHLKGEAKKPLRGYANDYEGYVAALKKLKHLFGQRSTIAQAVISKVTKGKQVQDHDVQGLSDFYYAVGNCLVNLERLNYISDLHSSETLRQAVQRLPLRLQLRWSEFSLKIRKKEEPNLLHLEEWLEGRVLALRQISSSEKRSSKKVPDEKDKDKEKFTGLIVGEDVKKCKLCPEKHNFWKCAKYKELKPGKKINLVRQANGCYNCLGTGHMSRNCESPHTCFVEGCSGKHHTTLHEFFVKSGSKGGNEAESKKSKESKENSKKGQSKENSKKEKESKENSKKEKESKEESKKDKEAKKESEKDKESDEETAKSELTALTDLGKREVFLQIVPVCLLGNNGKSFNTYALLDNGSQSTLLREDVLKKLDLVGKRKTMNMSTVKDEADPIEMVEVSLQVASRNRRNRFNIKSAYVTPTDKFHMPSRPSLKDCGGKAYKQLKGIKCNAIRGRDIAILIGANLPESLLHLDVRRGKEGEPIAVKTVFGWAVFGPVALGPPGKPHCSNVQVSSDLISNSLEGLWEDKEVQQRTHVNLTLTSQADRDLHSSVERFWLQEHCGILPPNEIEMSKEDISALKVLDEDTKLVDGQYEVPMLWEDPEGTLPNNYPMAKKRYDHLERRMKKDPVSYQRMNMKIMEYIKKGHTRKLSREEAKKKSKRTWYLPIHPIMNPKFRIVNDAAATYEGTSLNLSLKTGPDMMCSLVGILVRFRSGQVAISGDVEAMFHQVKVTKQDADSLRFLWKDDLDLSQPEEYQMQVHIFGAKDSPTCANYALKRTARDNQDSFDPSVCETVLKSFYVDDLLKSVDSEDSAITLITGLTSMLQCGHFRLTKFLSSSQNVLDSLPEGDVAPAATRSIDAEKVERALGVAWDTKTDELTFEANLEDVVPTKRTILKTTSSLFDPLGFLSPFLLKAKILLQELWRAGVDWDEAIGEDFVRCWEKWLKGVKYVSAVKLSRRYLVDPRPIQEVQLHVFCDASESAYGCVAYVRFVFKDGGYACSFVMSKTRLAPIKTITLPRLELNAARAGVRLSRLVVHEIDLPVEKVQFWSDSTIVLQYIRNDKHRMKTFVANRVTEISDMSTPDQWRHIAGADNPADALTRGVYDPRKLLSSNWFTGPDFLLQDEDSWPNGEISNLSSDDPEIKKKAILLAFLSAQEVQSFDVTRFSSWLRLKRAGAWLMRFIHNSRSNSLGDEMIKGPLRLQEISDAEVFLLGEIQKSAFQKEIVALRADKAVPPRSSLEALTPFIDSVGLLRVGGRLSNLDLPYTSRHQVILPNRHPVAQLIIDCLHRKNGHVGTEHVLSLLREEFWVQAGRRVIKGVLYKCFYCRVMRAKRRYPFMANLPLARAAVNEPPFTHCGVDLFGPILIKEGRKRLKRWGVLYTCLTVRCVHLEVAETCETDAFINAFRRFSNRRGTPKCVYSDNGTNFKGATTELQEFVDRLDQTAISNFATGRQIQWFFNPPKAPHMGGAWERLIRSVKEVMTGVVKDYILTDPQLYTLFTEAENIVNSRPLTHISDDVSDFDALTPNHILLGLHRNWVSIANTEDQHCNSRKKYKQVQGLANHFWSRFRKEYLPGLTKRSKWRSKQANLTTGELVLIYEEGTKRGSWPLGRIEKVMPGRDGVVRVAEVRTKGGVYVRPVSSLISLEENNDLRQGGENVTDSDQ